MKKERFEIGAIPAILYGEPAERGYLFLHGRMGCKEDAEPFARTVCPRGMEVLSVDLPGHGERQGRGEELLPWIAVEEIQRALEWAKRRWGSVSLRADDIGVYFALVAMDAPERALLASPILEMGEQIRNMLYWAGATEELLRQKGRILTPLGHSMTWEYLCWVREHPIRRWNCPIRIFWGPEDVVTSRRTLDSYIHYCGAWLTMAEGAAHWPHTPWELSALREWEERESRTWKNV